MGEGGALPLPGYRSLNSRFNFQRATTIQLEPSFASQRVGAKRRPMTGSAKQSIKQQERKCGLLRRFRLRSLSYGGQVAPRNDGALIPDTTSRPRGAMRP